MSDRGLVVIRFSTRSPYFMLSTSYGPFQCPDERRWFISLDHWIGWHMLAREHERLDVVTAANGWLAYQNLVRILKTGLHVPGDHTVVDDWDERRDAVMQRGVELKIEQNVGIRDLLVRTGRRTIQDHSRAEELHWCHANGNGTDMHGKLLMRVRDQLTADRRFAPHTGVPR